MAVAFLIYVHTYLVQSLHLLPRLGLAVAADHLRAVLVLQVAFVPLLRFEEHLAVRAPEQRRVVDLWKHEYGFSN